MNLLFIHETEYVDKMIFEYQIIPEILASKNHNVYVIDFPSHWKTEPIPFWDNLRSKVFPDISRANKTKGVTLIRPGFIRIPGLSRISAFFLYFRLINQTIRQHKINAMILLSAPTNGLQALWAARRNKIPVFFRLLDVLHQLVPSKLLLLPAYWIEKLVYRKVDQLYATSPRLKNYAIHMGADPDKCHYLPSGADHDLFYYQPKDDELLGQLGLSRDNLVLLFAGTLYNFSGLDRIIEAFPRWLTAIPNLILLIIGRGEQEVRLKLRVKNLNLEQSVIFTGFINYSDLPKYINLSDICINPFKINKTTNLIFPGKIYQYLACEKPVIASKLEGMLDIFPCDDPTSHIFYYETVEEFFHLVTSIKRDRFTDPNPSLYKIASRLEQEINKALNSNLGLRP